MKKTVDIFKVIFLLLVFTGVQVSNDYSIVRLCPDSAFADMSECFNNSSLYADYEKHSLFEKRNCSCNHNPQPVKINEIIVESRIAIPEITNISVVSLITTKERTGNGFIGFNCYFGTFLSWIALNYNNRQALTGCFLC